MSKVVYLEKPFVLKPYSKKELRAFMCVSKYIMIKWLNAMQPQLGEPVGGLYSIKQVQLIIDTYGVPGQLICEAA